jgi:hypothetical protein
MFQQSSLLNSFRPKENTLVYRCRGCNNNLASNDPASQYQRQKIIQNTVRVPSSLYTMNLGALNVYEKPNLDYSVVDISGSAYVVSPGVNWNQMSDRKQPHIQVVKTGAGTGYHSSSTRRTITANRPGAMSPGGAGVDIKHNSYDRYLNRIKAQKPIRRGPVPPGFGTPYIPFNRADPIYGGKIMKTSIVNDCNCPIVTDNTSSDIKLYNSSALQDQIYDVTYTYSVGEYVYAKKTDGANSTRYKAQIISIDNDTHIYTIRFEDGSVESVTGTYLSIYYDCNCDPNNSEKYDIYAYPDLTTTIACELLTGLASSIAL